MHIPSCYDPQVQEDRRQLQWDRTMARLQKCIGCGQPLLLVRYIDLTPFGVSESLCEDCFTRHSQWPPSCPPHL